MSAPFEDSAETGLGPDADGPSADADDQAFDRAPDFYAHAPRTTAFHKLRKRLVRQTREAIERYSMAPRMSADGVRPRWLVCLSGGKDSYSLLTILMELQWRGLLPVELVACNLDQGQPGFPKTVLPEYLTQLGVPHRIEYRDTYSVVMDKVPAGNTYCALCSRLRRGNLYRIAREEGCEAIVLGHHRDDILETFFLNLFHGGRISAMPPKLLNDDGDVLTLRPLALCAEADIERFARAMAYPIIPCDLCGSQDGLQRQKIKAMIAGWEQEQPGRSTVLFRSLANIHPSQMLDPKLFNFDALMPRNAAEDASDAE